MSNSEAPLIIRLFSQIVISEARAEVEATLQTQFGQISFEYVEAKESTVYFAVASISPRHYFELHEVKGRKTSEQPFPTPPPIPFHELQAVIEPILEKHGIFKGNIQ